MIPIAKPLTGGREKLAVADVLDSGHLAQGERVAEFERRFAAFIGVPHAVAVANGTAALQLALMALDIGPGDEVITVPFTFIATASAIALTGAAAVFVDVSPDDFCMNPSLVEAAVTSHTRAILPVSLYGQPVDMPALMRVATSHGLHLLEDASQAHGASVDDRKSGSWGSGGTFSFYATKNMTTGEGGMVTTRYELMARQIRLLRQHGAEVPYRHERLGFNYRMTDIAAAIGIEQLSKLPAFNARRRAIAARYDRELVGVITPRQRGGSEHVYHQYVIRVPQRTIFAGRLFDLSVQTGIHYPIPVHKQPPFVGSGSFPVTEMLTNEILSIPVHPGLSDDQVTAVIEAVNTVAAALG